jgi:VanZ family protein
VRLIFTFLSIVYIAGIFLWADSPVVSVLAPFNPYSLLHIPLYGILTVLLIFSFFPLKFKRNDLNDLNASSPIRFIIPGVISLIVAIADEIHQSFIPTRDASVIDVFLDAVGIVLILFLIVQLYKKKKILRTQLTQSAN